MAKEEKTRQPPTQPSSPEEKPSASEAAATTAAAGVDKATAAAADEEAPSLPGLRVAMALLFLLVFSACFATITEFYAFARQSAGAEMSGPFNCTLVAQNETNHAVACPPLNATQVCGVVSVIVDHDDFSGNGSSANDSVGDSVTRRYVMHQLYQDYFDHAECSYAYCPEGTAAKLGYGQQLRRWARPHKDRAPSSCWLDATKPDRAFVELQDFNHGKLFFSKASAYIILVVPPLGIAVSLVAVVVCLILGKLNATEVKMRADALP